MNPGLKPKELNVDEEDWKCFEYLCHRLGVSKSQRIRKLVEEDLKNNHKIILEGIENQKIKIEKRLRK